MPINANNWSTKQRHYMEWLATPPDLREERTQKAYCEAHKVDVKTLWRWKRKPGFWPEVQELCKQYLSDTVPEVIETFKNLARLGSFQHQKLYFEMIGMYVPKLAPTSPDGNQPYSGPIAFVARPDSGTPRNTNEVLAE